MIKKLLSLMTVMALTLSCASNAFATAVTADRANDADDLANGAAFDNLGAWTLTVADGATFTNGVITTAGNGGANAGTVTFAGSGTINTAASASVMGAAGNALLAVNVGANGSTVTVNGDTFATTYTITGTGTVNSDHITGAVVFAGNGVLSQDTGENINGAITNTTGAAAGTLTLEGSTDISGQIGAAGVGSLLAINAGAAGSTSTLSGDAFATTFTVTGTGLVNSDSITATTLNYAGDGTVSVDDNENITAAVATATTNTGTLTHEGSTTNTGQVGTATAVLKEINTGANGATNAFSTSVFTTLMDVTGTGGVTLNGSFGSSSFSSGVIDFEANGGTVTLADNASLFGSVTTQNAGQGNLTFNGTSTVSGAIGSNANYLNTITVGGAGETLTFQSNVFATDLTQGAANTIDIGANTIDLNGTADGDFSMNANGTLALTINSATVFGNIQANGATGSATVAATNSLNITVAGALANGQTLTIINATDDAVAAVPGTITDNSAIISFTASEATTGDVVLTAVTNTSGVGTTANSSTVLTSVNGALASGASGDMTTVLNSLYAISSTSAATAALEQLDPTGNNGVAQSSFNAGSLHLGTVTGHLNDVRSGVSSGSMTGLSTGEAWYETAMWAKGFGSVVDQDSRGGFNGYDADTWGASVGLDGSIAEGTRLGFAGGYADTEVENKGETGGSDIDTYQGTVYVGFDPKPLYVNTAFSFGWNSYDGSRNISFPGVSRTASYETDGQQYSVLVDGGYVIQHEQWEITPLASLEYSHLRIDGYTETGAGALNLTVDDQSYDFLQMGLGGKLALPIKNDSGTWVPEVHARWLYDFIGDEFQATSRFAGGGSAFTTRGLEPEQSALNAGGGITFYSMGSVSLSATYDFTYKEDYNSHYGEAVVRVDF